MKRIDIVNQRFGKLIATELSHVNNYPSGGRCEYWLCKCDCGNSVIVAKKNLLNGNTQSCGCARAIKNRERLTKHGGKKTKLYGVWSSMIARCYSENDLSFSYYGRRGITVCEQWRHNFENFQNWAQSAGYKDGLTIDRINVNDAYSPENCRWVNMTVQANNRSNTIYIEHNGERHTCAEWARMLNMSYDTINNRYHAGMSPEDILMLGRHKSGPKKHTHNITQHK